MIYNLEILSMYVMKIESLSKLLKLKGGWTTFVVE